MRAKARSVSKRNCASESGRRSRCARKADAIMSACVRLMEYLIEGKMNLGTIDFAFASLQGGIRHEKESAVRDYWE